MIIQLPIAMLACARIGAVHSTVFGGFGAEALASRVLDAKAKVLITVDGAFRATKLIPLKTIVDEAIAMVQRSGGQVDHVIVVRHLGDRYPSSASSPERPLQPLHTAPRDKWWHDVCDTASTACDPVWVDAEHPLFMLYTSGSTGKPKGALHSHGGYMIWVATTVRTRPLVRAAPCLPNALPAVQVYLRLSAGRRVLLHCGHWLDHRPLVHCVRAHGKWRHERPGALHWPRVRGRPVRIHSAAQCRDGAV